MYIHPVRAVTFWLLLCFYLTYVCISISVSIYICVCVWERHSKSVYYLYEHVFSASSHCSRRSCPPLTSWCLLVSIVSTGSLLTFNSESRRRSSAIVKTISSSRDRDSGGEKGERKHRPLKQTCLEQKINLLPSWWHLVYQNCEFAWKWKKSQGHVLQWCSLIFVRPVSWHFIFALVVCFPSKPRYY